MLAPVIATSLRVAGGLLLCWFACGCSAASMDALILPTDVSQRDWFDQVAVDHEPAVRTPPAALAADVGFDPPLLTTDLKVGDRVLFAIDLRDRVTTRVWFVRLTVAETDVDASQALRYAGDGPDLPRRGAAVTMTVYSAAGEPLSTSRAIIPREFPDDAIADANDDELSPAMLARVTHWASASVVAFLWGLRENKEIRRALGDVSGRPELLTRPPLPPEKIGLDLIYDRRETVPAPIANGQWQVDAWRLPMVIRVDGDIAYLLSLMLAAPRSPLNVSGGFISLVAVRPRNLSTRLRLQVIGARR